MHAHHMIGLHITREVCVSAWSQHLKGVVSEAIYTTRYTELHLLTQTLSYIIACTTIPDVS